MQDIHLLTLLDSEYAETDSAFQRIVKYYTSKSEEIDSMPQVIDIYKLYPCFKKANIISESKNVFNVSFNSTDTYKFSGDLLNGAHLISVYLFSVTRDDGLVGRGISKLSSWETIKQDIMRYEKCILQSGPATAYINAIDLIGNTMPHVVGDNPRKGSSPVGDRATNKLENNYERTKEFFNDNYKASEFSFTDAMMLRPFMTIEDVCIGKWKSTDTWDSFFASTSNAIVERTQLLMECNAIKDYCQDLLSRS